MNTVNLKINNIPVVAPEGATILEAAHLAGIRIPTLCYLKEINAIGACRICVSVLFSDSDRHNRWCHLRMRGKGCPRPGRRLCDAGGRGHGGFY